MLYLMHSFMPFSSVVTSPFVLPSAEHGIWKLEGDQNKVVSHLHSWPIL